MVRSSAIVSSVLPHNTGLFDQGQTIDIAIMGRFSLTLFHNIARSFK